MNLKIGGIYTIKTNNHYSKLYEYIIIIKIMSNIDKIIGISIYLNKMDIPNNKLLQEIIQNKVKLENDLHNFWIMSNYSFIKNSLNDRIDGYLGQIEDNLLFFLQDCSQLIFK